MLPTFKVKPWHYNIHILITYPLSGFNASCWNLSRRQEHNSSDRLIISYLLPAAHLHTAGSKKGLLTSFPTLCRWYHLVCTGSALDSQMGNKSHPLRKTGAAYWHTFMMRWESEWQSESWHYSSEKLHHRPSSNSRGWQCHNMFSNTSVIQPSLLINVVVLTYTSSKG